jgi:hypothetical protein
VLDKPLRDDLRHDLIDIAEALAGLIAQGERESVGDVIGGGGSEAFGGRTSGQRSQAARTEQEGKRPPEVIVRGDGRGLLAASSGHPQALKSNLIDRRQQSAKPSRMGGRLFTVLIASIAWAILLVRYSNSSANGDRTRIARTCSLPCSPAGRRQ